MFGKRADATLIKDLSTMRAIMPFISPRRNESLVLYSQEVEADAALAFLDEYNKEAPADQQLTLFHLLLRSLSTAICARPGTNRFVAGGRLWQRSEMWITFSAKIQLADRSPMVTVKRRYDEDKSIAQMVEGILSNLSRRRGGEQNQSDREMNLAMRFPAPLIRAGVWLLHQANQLGMLPKKMIDDDPLFTTIFVANLGSVNMESAYHHLWEYGTCSLFAMMGRVKQREDGTRFYEMRYTYDERINDGLYGGLSMELIKEQLENPETLV